MKAAIRELSVRRLVSPIVVAALLVPLLTNSGSTSSVGYPPRFWDGNNDGQVNGNDANVNIQAHGPNWTSTKLTSATSAATEWRTETNYNPTFTEDTGPVLVTVDGRQPSCGNFGSLTLAAACMDWTLRYYPGSTEAWHDIHDGAVFLNTDPDIKWNYGPFGYDSSDPRYSFWGVLTHEFGHVAGLRHEPTPCGNPVETMCPSTGMSGSFNLRSLTTSDINSANNRY